MNRLVAPAVLLLVASVRASAGNVDHAAQGQVYFFVGPIAATYAGPPPNWGLRINTGLGGEVHFYRGLGMGAEVGYARSGSIYQSVGIGSVDLAYHFVSEHSSRIEPFAIGGPSVYFGNGGHTTGFDFGGGLNYWVQKHVAIRFEIRDHAHIGPYEFPGRTGFVAFRFGVTFR